MRSPEQVQDELLVLDAQGGNRDAFERLVGRWSPRLFRFAWRLTGREDVARDVVQESWMAMIQGLNGLVDPASFRSWAFRIVRFKAVDIGRKEARQGALLRPERVPSPVPEDSIGAVLANLPPDDRAILSVFYLDDLSLEEIADIFDLPVGTVKSRLFYARSRLKVLLERSPR